uniref:Uncharacterized protein n=1 Tax=Aegilops tauschii subsp. strangulata TaxID=200361 RepID=A0A453DXV0_AEGTS
PFGNRRSSSSGSGVPGFVPLHEGVFLTNVLEPDGMPSARTRGDPPLRFLQSAHCPLEVATVVAKEADEYNGFNLILADLTRNVMVCVSNGPKGQPAMIQLVSPGLHVMSNARLDIPWQKCTKNPKGDF